MTSCHRSHHSNPKLPKALLTPREGFGAFLNPNCHQFPPGPCKGLCPFPLALPVMPKSNQPGIMDGKKEEGMCEPTVLWSPVSVLI